jgi:murein L,D-transpeptidase YcbB/YkuD
MFSIQKLSLVAICLYILMILISCRPTRSLIDTRSPGLDLVETKDSVIIPMDTASIYYNGLRRKNAVASIYQARGGKPMWLGEDHALNSMGDSMTQFVKNVGYYGLISADYHVSALNNAMTKALTGDDQIIIDVQLTDAFVTLSSDLRFGANSKPNQKVDSVTCSLMGKITSGSEIRTSLETREPLCSGYKTLKHVLRMSIDSLRNGSVIDSAKMLNRVRLIGLNLDRWRDEKDPFARRYVYINIPSFMLHVVQDDSIAFSSRIIVGATGTPTPQITSIIECFTIYPYWHVPRKIAVEEYLPMIQKDTSFISRNNFDILNRKGKVLEPDSIPWSRYHKNYFPVVLRQREGEENSLGIVKFLFDNPYAVYLHDTNAKKLFRSSKRAYSHGCIRMERAIELAHYLVTGSPIEKSGSIEKYIKMKERHTLNLKHPIPVYIRYFTAETVNGELRLYKDIYGRDGKMVDAGFIDIRSAVQK